MSLLYSPARTQLAIMDGNIHSFVTCMFILDFRVFMYLIYLMKFENELMIVIVDVAFDETLVV